jgi:hypothetical protein
VIPALLIFLVSMTIITQESPGLATVVGRRRLVLDRPAGAVLGALARVLFGMVTPAVALLYAERRWGLL